MAGKAFVDLMLPEEPTRQLLDNPDRLLADDVVVAVGELDGAIVAGAFAKLTAGGTSGYVSFVSTLTEARGRSMGDAVTRRVTREAFAARGHQPQPGGLVVRGQHLPADGLPRPVRVPPHDPPGPAGAG